MVGLNAARAFRSASSHKLRGKHLGQQESDISGNQGGGHLLDKQGSVSYDARERYVLFSGGFTEVGFILFIAFLLFGPKKLPEIARILGKGMGELRRASNELKNSLEEEIRNLDRKDEDTSYSSYSHHETQPYTELEQEGIEHPAETHELSTESESSLEPAPEYGYDYSEPSQQEPEPRG